MTAALKCACQSLAAAGWKVTCAACGSKTSATPSADATRKVDATQPVAFPVAPLVGPGELAYRLITLQALQAEATS